MIHRVRDLRLLPIVLIAITSLFALKTLGLMVDGGFLLSADDGVNDGPRITATLTAPSTELVSPSVPLNAPADQGRKSWAHEMFNFPDVTGSVDAPKPPEGAKPAADVKPAAGENPAEGNGAEGPAPESTKTAEGSKPGEGRGGPPAKPGTVPPPPSPQGTVIPLDGNRPVSEAERTILERLQQRREELDARGRELDIRESLLKAAEQRVEARVTELKDVESRITAATQQRDDAEATRFKGLVTMYENMKPKDAAKIFDRLDINVLLEVTTQINPRKMSDILAQMSPAAAERLTVELANRASMTKDQPQAQGADLPKIEGRRTGS